MAALSALSAIAGLAGTIVSAAGTLAAGKAQQQAAEYEAKSMEIQANEERAGAQQEAQEFRRRKDLALSAIQARAAASGLGPSDPTIINNEEDVAEYGEYQAAMAQFGGESRARGIRDAATVRRFEGQSAKSGAMYAAAGTILGGAANMFDKYASGYAPAYSGGRYG